MSGIASEKLYPFDVFSADEYISRMLETADEPIISELQLAAILGALGPAQAESAEPGALEIPEYFHLSTDEFELGMGQRERFLETGEKDLFSWKLFDSSEECCIRGRVYSVHATETWGDVLLIVEPAEEEHTYYISIAPSRY